MAATQVALLHGGTHAILPGLGVPNLHTAVAGMQFSRTLFQQGDVLFQWLEEQPKGQRRPNPTNSLAVNAETGASHTAEGDVTVWQLLDDDGNRVPDRLWLEVGPGEAAVVHNGRGGHEHAAMPLLGEGWVEVRPVYQDPGDAPGAKIAVAD